MLEFHEECDDGNTEANDGCSADCHFEAGTEPWCGNGTRDPGEECDDGVQNADALPDRCRTNCVLPLCGDGVTDNGEACDDGNRDADDGCDAFCSIEEKIRPLPVFDVPQIPLANLPPSRVFPRHEPVGSTGPGAIMMMAAGAAGGWSWLKRRRKR